ncbi:MAG: carbohydrate ABC transporter permease [Candidatus Limiplasma sp.]|nr:carbohydrate ABC transporter permease [Candidatus Limiplasma sp.]
MTLSQRTVLHKAILYGVVLFLVVVALFPLAWSIFGSLKSSQELYRFPYDLLPKAPTLDNFSVLFNLSNFFRSFSNTFFTSVAATALSLLVACLSGYSLTRFSFPGSRLLKRLILDTYMIPSILLVLPIYSILTKLNLRDNLVAYTFMVTSTTLPFCVWLMTSYFTGVSMSYEEAAMIDGCSRFQAFYRVVVPQLTPAIIATGIQAFILVWNDLMYAKILLSSEENRTLSLVISSMFAQEQVYPWGVILAGTVVATVPVLVMFIFGVDKLIGGWSEGGVKG